MAVEAVAGSDVDVPADKPAKKRGGKKKLLFIVAPLVLLIGGGAAAYLTGALDPLLGGSEAETVDAEVVPLDEHGVFFDVPELLVNLNNTGKKSGFLKLRVALEVEDEESVHQIEAVLPRVIDSFQVYLRELRTEDLKGSAGLYRLREELLLRVNAAARPAQVKDVLFKEMLVQ